MKEYYGNYLGLCINNDDPEKRGRVQVFVPHIMPALFENWNDAGEDIKLVCVGDNLPDNLPSPVVDKLKRILPWAESASPILGTSAPGNLMGTPSYSQESGSNLYNLSPVPDAEGYAGGVGGVTAEGLGAGATGDTNLDSLIANARGEGIGFTGSQSRCGVGSRRMVGALLGDNYFKSVGLGGYRGYASDTTIGGYTGGGSTNGYFQKSGYYSSPSSVAGTNYLNDSSQWRIGDVISSRNSSRSGAGHIQVYVGNGKWVSDFVQGGRILQDGYAGHTLHRLNSKGLAQLQSSGSVSNFATSGGPSGASTSTAGSGYETPSTSGQVAAASPHQSKTPIGSSTEDPSRYGSIADPKVQGSGSSSGSGTGGGPTTGVTSAGPSQTRIASVYGSVFNDFTTFLDVKPSERPAAATQYWQNKFGLTSSQLNDISSSYANPPAGQKGTVTKIHGVTVRLVGNGSPLTYANTTQGAYAKNLVPGLSVGVSTNYGLKPGSFIKITDSNGRPVGTNGGIFKVDDRGSNAALQSQGGGRGAIDFYAGSDSTLNKYFKDLNSSGQSLNVEPVNLSEEAIAQLNESVGSNNIAALSDPTSSGIAAAPPAGQMVQNPDPHGTTAVMDINNMAGGMFSYPAAGALIWCFFREGNPLYPVYFAASYGQREWQSAYRYDVASPAQDGVGYKPAATPDNPVISVGGRWNIGKVGALAWTDEMDPNDPTKNQKSLMISGHDGSNIFFNEGYHQIFSKFDRRDQVEGDRWETTLGQKEEWVQGDSNTVVMGDMFLKVGNVGPEAVEAVEKIQSIIKESMQPLTEPRDCSEASSGSSTTKSKSSFKKKAEANAVKGPAPSTLTGSVLTDTNNITTPNLPGIPQAAPAPQVTPTSPAAVNSTSTAVNPAVNNPFAQGSAPNPNVKFVPSSFPTGNLKVTPL